MSEEFLGKVKVKSEGRLSLPMIILDGNEASIEMGGLGGNTGDIVLKDKRGVMILRLGRDVARIRAYSPNGDQIFAVMQNADMILGGDGFDGDIILRSRDGQDYIQLDAENAATWLGGSGKNGKLYLFGEDADVAAGDEPAIKLEGKDGHIIIKGNIVLREKDGQDQIRLDSQNATAILGGSGKNGDIFLFGKNDDVAAGDEPNIKLNGEQGQITVKGDIVLAGADTAERFSVRDPENVHPGSVLVIDESGDLRISAMPYDTRVAGVVSGAGQTHPGIILNGLDCSLSSHPVALSGKVYCQVNTENGPVGVGDLLTTSSAPGFAMKADDPSKAFGAVVGKTLQRLEGDQGLIPILVSLH
jgi:hypothetical protein